jgi:hypothetical protein
VQSITVESSAALYLCVLQEWYLAQPNAQMTLLLQLEPRRPSARSSQLRVPAGAQVPDASTDMFSTDWLIV